MQSERKLAAIMFTDLVGFTAIGQKNEELSLSLLEEQRKLVRPIVAIHHGREVKTMGDAFLIEFPSALEAIRCAYDIQAASREFNLSAPEELSLRIRIGIHLGDVVESQNDIAGDAVNIASRIEPLAEGGGVCITRQVYDHINNKFKIPLESLGSKVLSGLDRPLEVFKMVPPWTAQRASSTTQQKITRIAVLPFANMSPDIADQYFADGVTEELITTLSALRGLTVIARSSVMRYKSSPKGAYDIGRDLNCDVLIEGSVRKAGNKVRIAVQLVDARTEGQVWAKNYDKELEDIFGIQSEIAEKVTNELRIQLLESERTKLESRATDDVQAYTLYLRARYHWARRSEEDVRTAIHYFEEAVGRDPEYTTALVGLADAYSISALFGYLSPISAFTKAKEIVHRALEMDQDSAEAHAAMGEILMHYSYDWAGAANELDRALKSNPNYSIAHVWKSSRYAALGQFYESLDSAHRAQELDPYSVVVMNELSKNLYYARRYEESTKQFNRSVEIEPDSAYLHKSLAETYVQRSMFEKATDEMEKALALSGRGPYFLDAASEVYALSGMQAKARAILKEIDGLAGRRFAPFYGRAAAYTALQDKEKALELLENAFAQRSWLIWINVDPVFDPLRNEHKFQSLLRKTKLLP